MFGSYKQWLLMPVPHLPQFGLGRFSVFSFKLLSIFSWSHLASLFTNWWRPWLNLRRGTNWGRPRTAPKQRTSSYVWPSGPSERPFCYLLLASDRSWCSGASSRRRKVLLGPPLKCTMLLQTDKNLSEKRYTVTSTQENFCLTLKCLKKWDRCLPTLKKVIIYYS